MTIKYELIKDKNATNTPCENINQGVRVASFACQKMCEHFGSIDTISQVVLCHFGEEK